MNWFLAGLAIGFALGCWFWFWHGWPVMQLAIWFAEDVRKWRANGR